MKPITLFKGTVGLNNVVDPTRLKFDPESAMCELASAYNVDIDVSGRVSRRKGLTATTQTTACHSMWSSGNLCYYVAGTSLYRLNPDYSRTGLRSGLTAGAKMSFVRVASTTYYTNGFENGRIKGDVSYTWVALPYVGPVTTKLFSSPPVGHLLEFHSSRVYIATDFGLVYSEPFAYSWFDLHGNIVSLRSKPRMLRAVKEGLFVGLDDGVIFLQGKNPKEFEYNVVSDSPVVTGTDVNVSGDRFGKNDKISLTVNTSINAVMWTAQDGIYLGQATGEVKNLTKDKITYSSSQKGCAVFKDNKYITLMQ